MNENERCGRLARRSQSAVQLRHWGHLLLRKWWVLALGAAAGIAASALVLRWQAPAYVSAGQMIVNLKVAIPEGAVFTEELGNFLGTQAALMQSEVVLNRAWARATTSTTNPPTSRPLLRVGVTPRTTIFNLECSAPDPGLARSFLQGVMEEYIRLKREMRKQASDSTVAGLTEQLLSVEKELQAAEEEVAGFQGTNNMVWLEEQSKVMGNYLAGLNQRLEGMRSEHELLENLTLDQALSRENPGRSEGEDAGGATGNDLSTNGVVNNQSLAADYLKAKQQVLLMKTEKQELGQYLRPKHPRMVAMEEDISRRERLLEIYRQQNVEQLEARKASAALQVRMLEKEVAGWNGRMGEISRRAAEYQRLRGNCQRLQGLYQQMVGTVERLDVNREVGAETVSVMEAASPARLDRRRERRGLWLAGFGCVLATLALLLFLDRLDDRVNSLSELEEAFEAPVLAQIPREGLEREDPRLVDAADERHAFLEAYRNLRSSLLYPPEPGRRPRTLLVTSSVPSEGKSVTAANLGVVLALGGARVLVVDADLRKGVLHARFRLEAAPGLSEALGKALSWRELATPTSYPGLQVLPRGSLTGSSGELFLRPGVPRFLKEASEEYDFVVLDTAPVMAADDVTTLAPHSDAVLFVVRAERTSARVARAALELLRQRNARVMGIVFNAVRRASGEYYCYRYKEYYRGGGR